MTVLFDNNNITIPISYHHYVQSMIYNCLDKAMSQQIHNQQNKRNYKFFVFSRLMSDEGYKVIDNKYIIFNGDIKLMVSSANVDFLQSLFNGFLLSQSCCIANKQLNVKSVHVNSINITGNETFHSLSSVIVRSTLYDKTNKPFVYYYSPYERNWQVKVFENLARKYFQYTNKQLDTINYKINIIKASREKIFKYKNLFFKGYDITFKFENIPVEIIKFIINVGLGEKNSSGFGMIFDKSGLH